MKKIYIAPWIKTVELGDELCNLGLEASNEEDRSTPGNDTYIPVSDEDLPTFGGDELEGSEPA